MTTRETYTITLEALGDDTRPPVVRLKRLLKAGLRNFRLKCVGLSQPGNEQQQVPLDDLELK